MSFQQGDAIMNAAFNASTTEQFLAAHDHAIPEAMFQVYQAFDEGEYCHSKAGAEVDPETKYTKPLIQAFLAKFRD
ncbi:hypothetical protein SDC9_119066 [bioreactor metagenome]|uniref:Uncharacterized protein n=1 Tax=bioreactor metagenome TaxID=1076179 RepID=A0A645C8H3_9ZZZZ